MALDVGLTFAPQRSTDPRERATTSAALGPSERALQILSLHLPRILGARAVSPASLLTPSQAPAPSVSPESAVLQSALRSFLGQSAAPSPAPAGFPPDTPMTGPNVLGPSPKILPGPSPIRRIPAPDLTTSIDEIVRLITTPRAPYVGVGELEGSYGPPAPAPALPPQPPRFQAMQRGALR